MPATDRSMSQGTVVADERVRIRRMSEADFAAMAGWLNQPHVRYWWDPDGPPATDDTVRHDYGKYLEPESQSVVCVIEDGGRSVGFVQFYPWSAEAGYMRKVGISVEPAAWAFDVFVGEPDA